MRFGSLFSGCGGMDLGLERAGMTCAWQVEIDDYATKVLERHWPNVPKFRDVREVGGHNLERVDVIAGGFPCQDISYAGSGLGLEGERSGLWSEYKRLIGVLRPRFVLVENSAALLRRGMGTILRDLAGLRFDAEWSVVSACSLGASHVRRRLFVVAYSNSEHGRERIRNTLAQQDWSLQAVDGTPRARPRAQARMANPSELYRGADGIPNGPHRNRCVGNAVYPDIAEWIGRRIIEADSTP